MENIKFDYEPFFKGEILSIPRAINKGYIKRKHFPLDEENKYDTIISFEKEKNANEFSMEIILHYSEREKDILFKAYDEPNFKKLNVRDDNRKTYFLNSVQLSEMEKFYRNLKKETEEENLESKVKTTTKEELALQKIKNPKEKESPIQNFDDKDDLTLNERIN